MKNIYLLIFALVLVAGCIDLGFIFGSNVISLQTKSVVEEPRDALVVTNVVTLPNPPLLPDQPFTVSMVLENKDQLKTIKNIEVDLFNAPTFKSSFSPYTICNTQELPIECDFGAADEGCDFKYVNACQPNTCGVTSSCKLLPGEQSVPPVTFQLKAPTQAEIAGIKTDTELNIKTNYDFDGSFVYIIPVVNIEEIIRLQTEGKKLTIEESKMHSSGPVMIDAEFIGAKYILSSTEGSSTPPQKSIINFKITNTGKGSIKDSKIEISTVDFGTSPDELANPPDNSATRKGIFIIFPEDLEVKEVPGNFECAQLGLGTRCRNKVTIQIFKDESRVSMRFGVVPKLLPVGTPFRSTTIKAFVWYNYELRNTVSITINPFQNV